MNAAIRAIEYCLPDRVLSNGDVCRFGTGWTAQGIEAKTGVAERRVVGEQEDAHGLAYRAAKKLLDAGTCARQDVDYLVLCTHSASQPCSVTACQLQDQLGLPTHCGAVELTLGCSGFVYALGLVKGLIETGQAHNVVLMTTDTYSRFLADDDVGLRSIFGDGAAATLIQACHEPSLEAFVYGTDGSGSCHLQYGTSNGGAEPSSPRGCVLTMDGPEVFNFTLHAVPEALARLSSTGGVEAESTDLYIFHQANAYMLEHLRKRLGIPKEKFLISMKYTGNTVSSSIPIALKHAMQERLIVDGSRVVLAGFGIGLSWAACRLIWRGQ